MLRKTSFISEKLLELELELQKTPTLTLETKTRTSTLWHDIFLEKGKKENDSRTNSSAKKQGKPIKEKLTHPDDPCENNIQ